jgi:hypothetical protein
LVEILEVEDSVMLSCPGRRAGCGLGSDIPAINDAIAAGNVSTTASSSNWLQDLIGGAVSTVEDIFKAKNTVRGVLTQTSPGVFQYVQPEGSSVTLPVTTSSTSSLTASGSSTGLILMGGAALLLVFLVARK